MVTLDLEEDAIKITKKYFLTDYIFPQVLYMLSITYSKFLIQLYLAFKQILAYGLSITWLSWASQDCSLK